MYGSTVMCCESVCFVRFNYIVYFMPFTVLLFSSYTVSFKPAKVDKAQYSAVKV